MTLYVGTAVIPLAVNVYMLAVFLLLSGIATGSLNSGNENCNESDAK